MKQLKISYICFAAHGHLDWGGTLETLKELQNRDHKVTVLSGEKIKDYVTEKGLPLYDIGLENFRPREEGESIEDTLAYHQFTNFFHVPSIVESFKKGTDYLNKDGIDIILSDPLCKIGPLISMKTGIPYAVLGHFYYKPEGRVAEDNKAALEKFIKEFKVVTDELGVKDGYKLPFMPSSPWLNIAYSTPDFDGDLCESNITHVGADPLFPQENREKSKDLEVFYSSGTIFWDYAQIEAVLKLTDFYPMRLYITKGKIMPQIDQKKNVTIFDFCDDKKMIPNMDILITQGGLGTVSNGIRSATPMLVLPLMWGNMSQAIKVNRYGNGISLNSLDDQIKYLKGSFEKLILNNSYKKRAEKLQKEFASYGGSKKAADLICDLAK